LTSSRPVAHAGVRGGSASGAGGKPSFEDLDFSELEHLRRGYEGVHEEGLAWRQEGTACFQCHTAQKDHDYVFSVWRE